jgi:hypothetical protein
MDRKDIEAWEGRVEQPFPPLLSTRPSMSRTGDQVERAERINRPMTTSWIACVIHSERSVSPRRRGALRFAPAVERVAGQCAQILHVR